MSVRTKRRTARRAELRVRTRELELFDQTLDTCIQELKELRISKHQRDLSSIPSTVRVISTCSQPTTPTIQTPIQTPIQTTYPSPPQTPKPHILPQGLPTTSKMDRSSPHSQPRTGGLRGPMPSWYGTQDSRGNHGFSPVRPEVPPVKLNLKKNAVKVVGPATQASPQPQQQRTPQPQPRNIAMPVTASPKYADGPANIVPPPVPAFTMPAFTMPAFTMPAFTMPAFTMPVAASPKDADGPANIVPPPVPAFSLPLFPVKSRDATAETAENLASMFAKLTSDQPLPAKATAVLNSSPPLAKPPPPAVATPVLQAAPATPPSVIENANDDPEQRYLRKAAAYLDALPVSGGATPVILMQNVAAKLRKVRRPVELHVSNFSDETKRAYAQSAVKYINNNSGETDFLQLCAQLVADKVIAIDMLDEVDNLCHAILDCVLNEAPKAPNTPQVSVSNDPMVGANAWPTQEKRENVAENRTVLLRGISTMNTVNKVQALVWGGKLESILVDPAKDFALVKFLTPEGCQKYFHATANGVKLEYEGKQLMFLPERQPGPNSANDVVKNCIDGDVSRCVRAVDAEEDWNDRALRVLAEGKGKFKRELDCIKRGKNARGRFYIEFRFATIYHALNFKRALVDDVEWEHCNIQYALDPCEVASGVHLKDETE